MERDFKGVWIPKEIWLDERLTALDKIILTEIDSLDGEEGCYASNEYLAEFCQCCATKVSTSISLLIKLGYVEVKKFDGRKRFLKSCLIKKVNEPLKNCKAECKKIKDNNIYNNIENNIDINNTNKLVSLEQAPKTYGNEQINEMFDEWEKMFGYKPKNCANNRRAVYNMLRAKDKGKDWLLKTMLLLREAQKDRYAGKEVLGVAGFSDMQYNYEKIWKWGATKNRQRNEEKAFFDLANL